MLLNARAWDLVDDILDRAGELRIARTQLVCGAQIFDFGVQELGSLQAGIRLAEVCMSGLAKVRLTHQTLGSYGWPKVNVWTDHPIQACLYSQYAGWAVKQENYFAMCSGPIRASAATEPLFEKLNYREEFYCCVGVLEAAKLPNEEVVKYMAQKANIQPRNLLLLVARTSSLAGNLQIVARSVETAMHKLFELGYDVKQVVSASGSAHLPPVAKDDLAGIGRTNDAILYGASVTMLVKGDDAQLAELGPKVPASSSPMYGRPFIEIFKEVGYDFYKIDPLMFSPAQIVFNNIETGTVHTFGQINEQVLMKSFGMK